MPLATKIASSQRKLRSGKRRGDGAPRRYASRAFRCDRHARRAPRQRDQRDRQRCEEERDQRVRSPRRQQRREDHADQSEAFAPRGDARAAAVVVREPRAPRLVRDRGQRIAERGGDQRERQPGGRAARRHVSRAARTAARIRPRARGRRSAAAAGSRRASGPPTRQAADRRRRRARASPAARRRSSTARVRSSSRRTAAPARRRGAPSSSAAARTGCTRAGRSAGRARRACAARRRRRARSRHGACFRRLARRSGAVVRASSQIAEEGRPERGVVDAAEQPAVEMELGAAARDMLTPASRCPARTSGKSAASPQPARALRLGADAEPRDLGVAAFGDRAPAAACGRRSVRARTAGPRSGARRNRRPGRRDARRIRAARTRSAARCPPAAHSPSARPTCAGTSARAGPPTSRASATSALRVNERVLDDIGVAPGERRLAVGEVELPDTDEALVEAERAHGVEPRVEALAPRGERARVVEAERVFVDDREPGALAPVA